MSGSTLQDRVAAIRERIAAAAGRAGRSADDITLVAVSKTHSADAIRAAFIADLEGQWHLIGHLQSNKAARAARMFDSVDSVDDFALAQRLDRARAEMGGENKLRVLIEVRVTPEITKSGVERETLPKLADQLVSLPCLDLKGLMCIPPFLHETEQVRPYFSNLRVLKDELEKRLGRKPLVLSMGMSHDFEVAIEEGATEIRVGTALFGTRQIWPNPIG